MDTLIPWISWFSLHYVYFDDKFLLILHFTYLFTSLQTIETKMKRFSSKNATVRAIVTFPAHRGSIRGCSPVINTRWPGYNPSPSLLFSLPINRPGVGYGFPFDKGAESAYKFRWPRDSVRINIFLTSSFFHPTSLPVRSIANSLEYAWRRGWHTARARGRAPS